MWYFYFHLFTKIFISFIICFLDWLRTAWLFNLFCLKGRITMRKRGEETYRKREKENLLTTVSLLSWLLWPNLRWTLTGRQVQGPKDLGYFLRPLTDSWTRTGTVLSQTSIHMGNRCHSGRISMIHHCASLHNLSWRIYSMCSRGESVIHTIGLSVL